MFENGSKRPPTFEWWHCWKQAEISAVFLQLAMVVWKWQKTDHQPFSGDFVGKRQKFRPFSNNHNQLFENGRKQTINNSVGTLLENGRNFGRFPTTGFRPFSNNPKCFGRFPTNRFRPFSNNFFRPFSTSPNQILPAWLKRMIKPWCVMKRGHLRSGGMTGKRDVCHPERVTPAHKAVLKVKAGRAVWKANFESLLLDQDVSDDLCFCLVISPRFILSKTTRLAARYHY